MFGFTRLKREQDDLTDRASSCYSLNLQVSVIILFQVVDLRTVSFDVPPQEILSKDSVTVAVDAVVYYKVN